MKKSITIILLATYLLVAMMVHANNDDISGLDLLVELNIINESYFSKSDTVTRGECIIAIMRVIGVTDDEIEKINGSDFTAFADTCAYSYFGCAYRARIAYGEECIVTHPTYRTTHTLKNTDSFFFSERAATVKETLAFMVRCLEEMNPEDFEFTVEKAKAHGLITDEDLFIKDVNSAISKNDYCTLLKRMLQQKRYKYYGRVDNRFKMEGIIDEEQSMTYLEFLTQKQIAE